MTDNINTDIEEFAKKYAGREVYILDNDNNIETTARILGFYKEPLSRHLIVVDFPTDNKRQQQCWLINEYIKSIQLTINEDVKHGFVVEYKNIKLITYTNPYPNKCNRCNHPARINKRIKLCSNINCKMRSRYIKGLMTDVDVKKIKSENIIKCPICSIYKMLSMLQHSTPFGGDESKKYKFVCVNKHRFHANVKLGYEVNCKIDNIIISFIHDGTRFRRQHNKVNK